MAKKKKSQKKHQFKPSVSVNHSSQAAPQPADNLESAAAVAAKLPSPLSFDIDNLDLIKADIRKVLVLAVSFVILQIVLWLVLGHTSFGTSVYHLVKI